MKKVILSICSFVIVASIVFISCKKKNDDSAITPGYTKDGIGTGANPNTTIVTTTGTVATTATANQNSSFSGIGTSGTWSSINCSTNPAPSVIQISNSSLGSNVAIYFNGPVAAGSYALVSSNSSIPVGSACLVISNPPSQPSGTTWYSASGSITVTNSGNAYTATFNNISCYQQSSTFPTVTASGQVGCL